ncbi:MAG: hypothetical protein [Sanya fiers-like virus 10]|nr:MAG: hypothetical protein [Sanya fiers-like virus 10]UUW21241.1 MAG: hypothetical protein [Sanya fiers-like virus 10]
MPQAGNLTVNDGAATPVAVTFYPERVTPDLAVFVDRRKTVRALQPSIKVGLKPATAARNTYQVPFEVEYPIEGVVNGVAQAIGIARYKDGKFIIPDFMPAIDRAHLVAFSINGLNAVKAAPKDLDPYY